MARVIDCPKDKEGKEYIVEIANGEPMTFKKFITMSLDVYPPAGKGLSMVRQAMKIVEKVETMNGSVTFEDAEYSIVKSAVEEMDWKPAAARKFVPYFEAVIEKAQEVKI